MTDLEARFWAALSRLEDWHLDSVAAQSFDGPQSSPTKPGATVLRSQPYPHRQYWVGRWKLAKGSEGKTEVVEEIEGDIRNLSLSPSKKHTFVINTLEWKEAIAREEGTSEHVARLWCVGPSTVRKYRKLYRANS